MGLVAAGPPVMPASSRGGINSRSRGASSGRGELGVAARRGATRVARPSGGVVGSVATLGAPRRRRRRRASAPRDALHVAATATAERAVEASGLALASPCTRLAKTVVTSAAEAEAEAATDLQAGSRSEGTVNQRMQSRREDELQRAAGRPRDRRLGVSKSAIIGPRDSPGLSCAVSAAVAVAVRVAGAGACAVPGRAGRWAGGARAGAAAVAVRAAGGDAALFALPAAPPAPPRPAPAPASPPLPRLAPPQAAAGNASWSARLCGRHAHRRGNADGRLLGGRRIVLRAER
ncbi:Protein of unknown function [Gryllus bimaculatus]|nr:Protein of unknown function [Gryllus bimaculatus]